MKYDSPMDDGRRPWYLLSEASVRSRVSAPTPADVMQMGTYDLDVLNHTIRNLRRRSGWYRGRFRPAGMAAQDFGIVITEWSD